MKPRETGLDRKAQELIILHCNYSLITIQDIHLNRHKYQNHHVKSVIFLLHQVSKLSPRAFRVSLPGPQL
jgi:hypothetical protein